MHLRFNPIRFLRTICLAAALIAAPVFGSGDAPKQKIKIDKLDDLPKHMYPVSGKASVLINSKERVLELARTVRADVEADLAGYEITDPTTLKRMYGTLLSIDLIEGKFDAALARIEQIRALEDKEAKKLTAGLTNIAMIAAKREVGSDAPTAEYKAAFSRHLTKLTAALPWSVVQDTIQQSKGRLEIFSENLLRGLVEAQMDPVVAETGELNGDQAAGVIGIRFTIDERLPLKSETIAVYQKLIEANKTVKPDIWEARSVALSKDMKLKPVLAAVWDSGVDADIFYGRMFVNASELRDGKDNDGNGFVDDIHGIAYDMNAHRATGVLFPLGDAAARMPQVMQHTKGLMDIQAAIDSPEATELKRHLSSLDSADVKGFLEDLSLAGNYSHGTHVAGIMAAGNPFIRLLVARHTYDYHTIPVARTEDWGERDGAKCLDTVEYLKRHRVRVVNMSWGESQQDAEDSLEANGIGESAEERLAIARRVFASQKEGLYNAIKNAPDILFVCAAGNADNDVEFDEYIASSFELPNLITVGAVDQAGDPTSFTSFGKTVQVYANGFEVESYVPGGARMKFSGTSMAAPNVANLAAKMIAVDPTLTPTKVIELIKKGADRTTAGGTSFLLMNPKKTMDLL